MPSLCEIGLAEEVLSVGRRVRESVKYDGHAPLVAMPERYDREQADAEANAGGNDAAYLAAASSAARYAGRENSAARGRRLKRIWWELQSYYQSRASWFSCRWR